MAREDKPVPWYLWPFHAVWRLLGFVLATVGRLACGVIGVVLLIVGTVLSLTVVAAPLGVPLLIVGFLLVVRALF